MDTQSSMPANQQFEPLDEIALVLFTRFQQGGDPHHLEESISVYRQALACYPSPHSRYYSSSNNLAVALFARFRQRGEVSDLQESFFLWSHALDSPYYPDRQHIIKNLANVQSARILQGVSEDFDLDHCVFLRKEALELNAPDLNDTNRIPLANDLALAHWDKFQGDGGENHLGESRMALTDALSLCSSSNLYYADCVNNLALVCHQESFIEGIYEKDDDEEYLDNCREALESFPSHQDQPLLLSVLTTILHSRMRQKDDDDKSIFESISLCRKALEILSPLDPKRARIQHTLAIALTSRYQQRFERRDLEESIFLHKQVLANLSPTDIEPSELLENLAIALRLRYEEVGEKRDLEECISLYRQALELWGTSDSETALSINDFACVLLLRYDKDGDRKDLEECIYFFRQTYQMLPQTHQCYLDSINNLAKALSIRFKLNGDLSDLEESISLFRQSQSDYRSPVFVNQSQARINLADVLFARYEQTGQESDMEESISLFRSALNSISTGHHKYRSASLVKLGNALCTRFSHSSDQSDLDESIGFYKEALELYPPPHPEAAEALDKLAAAFETRSKLYDAAQPNDLYEAQFFRQHAEALRRTTDVESQGMDASLISLRHLRIPRSSKTLPSDTLI